MVRQRVSHIRVYIYRKSFNTYLVLGLGLVLLDDLDREAHAALLVLEVLRRALRKWKLAVNFFVRI